MKNVYSYLIEIMRFLYVSIQKHESGWVTNGIKKEFTTETELLPHGCLLVRRGISWLKLLGDINQSKYQTVLDQIQA